MVAGNRRLLNHIERKEHKEMQRTAGATLAVSVIESNPEQDRKITVMKTASFNRFEFALTREDVDRCHHTGTCDDDVYEVSQYEYVVEQFNRIEKETIRTVLKEYAEWNSDELADDAENRRRVVWLAAADIQDAE